MRVVLDYTNGSHVCAYYPVNTTAKQNVKLFHCVHGVCDGHNALRYWSRGDSNQCETKTSKF